MSASAPVALRPRASILDLLRGRARLLGPRLVDDGPPGLLSPVEARVHLGLAYEDLRAAEHAALAELARCRPWARLGVVGRAALAALLSAAMGTGAESRRVRVVAAEVDNVTVPEALDAILAPVRGPARLVFFAHAHALTLARKDPRLADDLARADLVLPDGIGVRLAAALAGVRIRANVNGTDLLPLLCARAAAAGVPLVLVGGADGVARDAAAALEAQHPGLRIPLAVHGFLDDAARRDVVAATRALAASGGCLVLVGMGSPVQERFARAHFADVEGACVLTVGGLFDFTAGRVPRAPLALRELGLEWAFRLAQEPRRLARRYLLGIPRFLAYALVDRLRRVREVPALRA